MKLKHSFIVIAVLVAAFLAMSGCNQPLSQQDKAALEQARQSTNQLGAFIKAQQDGLGQLKETFDALGDKESSQKVQDVQSQLDTASKVSTQVSDSLGTVAQQATGTEAIATGVGEVGKVVAPFAGPYAPLVTTGAQLAQSLILLFAGLHYGKKQGEKVGEEKIASFNNAVKRKIAEGDDMSPHAA